MCSNHSGAFTGRKEPGKLIRWFDLTDAVLNKRRRFLDIPQLTIVMEQSTAKFLLEGKVVRPPRRFREMPRRQTVRHKRRLSQESDREKFRAKRLKVSLETSPEATVVKNVESLSAEVPVTSSYLFRVLGQGLASSESKPPSLGELLGFTDDEDVEDDVFLPEGSESETSPERYEESLQLILDTLRYGTEDSIQTLLGFLRTSL